jgi:predicted nucleotidyltransferase
MRAERPTVPEDVLAVARGVAVIVRRVTADPAYRVLLFGSWVSGRAGERSDIDIGILGPSEVDPSAMAEIRETCEALPTLRTVDLVDLSGAPPDLRRAALSEGLEVEPA